MTSHRKTITHDLSINAVHIKIATKASVLIAKELFVQAHVIGSTTSVSHRSIITGMKLYCTVLLSSIGFWLVLNLKDHDSDGLNGIRFHLDEFLAGPRRPDRHSTRS